MQTFKSFNEKEIKLLDKYALKNFNAFCYTLSHNYSLKSLAFSSMHLHIFLTLKLAASLEENSALEILDLSNSAISTFGLKYIFKRLKTNKSLRVINFFNSVINAESI